MLEVNRIEVTIKQFADVIELGLIHPSLNDLYNELIGGYILSGYIIRIIVAEGHR